MILGETTGWTILVNALNFIIPAGIVFGVTYYLIDKLLGEQRKVRLLELKKEQLRELTPLKLQAYERLTLFLDRISPENLVVRLSRAGQSANQLRHELVQTIQSEYNHNISQQIYISNDAWQMIKAVKEQTIAVIDDCYRSCDDTHSGPDLGKKVLQRLMANNNISTQIAIELLKKEIEIVL